MKKLKKKIIVVVSAVILSLLAFFYFGNIIYRQQVVKAIENHDADEVKSLTRNTFFTLNGSYVFWAEVVFGNKNHMTPLQTACFEGNIEIVTTLLENGANPSYTYWSSNHFSPLMSAGGTKQLENRMELLKLLLENGADIKYVNKNNYNILGRIVNTPYNSEQDIATLKYLESQGADFSTTSEGNLGLVFFATLNNNVDILEVLVKEKQFDINSTKSPYSQTPLIRYCFVNREQTKHIKTIQTLLDLGADKAIKDEQGKTAYDYAEEYGYDFAELLKP